MKSLPTLSKISNKCISNKSTCRKIGLSLFYILCFNFIGFAQDIQFSQFYANVLYLNPAFAGSSHQTRLIGHQRLQWPRLDAKYITSSFSIDHFFAKANSGIGLMILRDVQGSNIISSTEISLQYSYELVLSSKLAFRAGAQGTYASRYINYNYLKFPDQYNVNGFTGQSTKEPFGYNQASYFDVSVGGILYSEHFWAGLSAYHINTPNQSFYGDVSNLPMKVMFVGGYKFNLSKNDSRSATDKKEITLTPTLNYKSQGKSDQLDLGIYGIYERIMLGLWYRGIPVKHYHKGLQNNESIVWLIGWKYKGLQLGYSYDFTISKLNLGRTGGSHEINITYIFNKPAKKKRVLKKIPCPDFK
ncbi:PorP/SprF family type IX secretion system membrane protein [Cytophaga aurantiaca]|uniref:PorP/SprF family type IX secretion system membrane protein n=1 Tax=Cytophaga aurantiaca TaxID=29530 RepID=UPI00036C546C|nr:type IX secretion system membrane protein PorP/SprF [Cytophaga aurantiaca]